MQCKLKQIERSFCQYKGKKSEEELSSLARYAEPMVNVIIIKDECFAFRGEGFLECGVIGDYIVREGKTLITYSSEDFHNKYESIFTPMVNLP